MSNGIVCLTFDFDAVSLWISRSMTTATPVSRGEFGVTAIPRIIDLLKSRELTATFFVPGHTIESFPDACNQIVAAGHEIALHGWAHENVANLDASSERAILERAYADASSLVGSPPKGYRSPAWDLSRETLRLVTEMGLSYDSSLMSDDYRPFRPRIGDSIRSDQPMQFGEVSQLVEFPISWTVDDYPQFEYLRMPSIVLPGMRRAEDVFASWSEDIEYMQRDFDHGVLTVTFHPQVIGRGHRLLGLERWLDSLIEAGLRFARLDTIAQEINAGGMFGAWKPGGVA